MRMGWTWVSATEGTDRVRKREAKEHYASTLLTTVLEDLLRVLWPHTRRTMYGKVKFPMVDLENPRVLRSTWHFALYRCVPTVSILDMSPTPARYQESFCSFFCVLLAPCVFLYSHTLTHSTLTGVTTTLLHLLASPSPSLNQRWLIIVHA